MPEILSNEQMAEADYLTIKSGVAGYTLMCNAGQVFVDVLLQNVAFAHCLILCGPGNNGGDGYVIARLLKAQGCEVSVAALVPTVDLKGDAAQAAEDWAGEVVAFDDLASVSEDTIVIDAVFGTGLSKPLGSDVIRVFDMVRAAQCPVVAVDIPSGVSGDSGVADPHTLYADITVTFFRKKLGHVLMPGMDACGLVYEEDISIPDPVLEKSGFAAYENEPSLWMHALPYPDMGQHKYHRGHTVVLGGEALTGAARLASEAAMRIGSGLCTVVTSEKAADIYRSAAAHIMVEAYDLLGRFADHIKDERRNVALIGPGAGLKDKAALKAAVLETLATGKGVVLDADALSCFEDDKESLYEALHENVVLTPHEGEFKRLFGDIQGHKLEKAQKAAELTGAVMLLKGADTVIAGKGYMSVINVHASPYLATGGSGDVLAGLIAGLMAQGVKPFDAACIASWIHGEAGLTFGPGMVSSDIIEIIPEILSDFA